MSQRSERSVRRHLVTAILALTTSFTPSVAAADDGLRFSVDWDKLAVVLHEGAAAFLPHEPLHTETVDQAQGKPESFFGTSPRLALVARDWGVSQVLWGHLAVTDQFRLSRSSRMVVTRLRLADGRFAPFVHIGVGQWRADTSVVPTLSNDVDLAGQLGGGFELEVAPQAVVALEADCTVLYREGHDPDALASLASGQLWATVLAARARF
ncbi:MAG TPA: hypothetical protein VGL81_09660 [Polyangiaceae bacterium]|jgi:hypothetical protein